MKKFLAMILALVMVFSLAACGSSSSSGDGPSTSNETYTLQMAINTADIPVLGDWPDKINEATNGRVTIELVDLSSLGTPADALAAVREGLVDILFNSAAQTGSDFPVMDIFQLPFMCDNPTQGADLLYAMLHAGYLDQEMADFEPMMFLSTDMQMIFTNTPIDSISDLSGKKIRATSGISASMVELLGASVVTMGLGDVYLALSTGVVDGGMSSPVMIRSMAFNETAPYLIDSYLFTGGIMCLMNDDRWESLPADIQLAFREVNAQHSDWCKWNQTQAMLDNINHLPSNGMTLVQLSDADKQAMIDACSSLEQEWVDKVTALGYNGQEMLDYAKQVLG